MEAGAYVSPVTCSAGFANLCTFSDDLGSRQPLSANEAGERLPKQRPSLHAAVLQGEVHSAQV